MSSRTVASLHLTNGDAVIYLFKKAGILGTHVPWRDVLHEGPVPAGLPLEALSRIRGSFLASRGYGKPIKVLHDFQSRDAAIRRAAEFEEVVLWFEHDLYDQLQLLQILVSLDELRLEPGRVSIVQSDTYLGSMTAAEIEALYPKRRTITKAAFALARKTWDAFTSDDPALVLAQTIGDAPGFPHLRAAFQRLCEEYPWESDGLSRSQRQALQAVAQGAGRNDELFARAQAREEAPFLGDKTFGAILDDLQHNPFPLIEQENGALVPTALGRRILAGDVDWLEMSAIDRWIGGVHFHDGFVPRWNDDRRTFEIPEKADGS